MNASDSAIAVALLSDQPARNEHLRAALGALGAPVAYESRADAFDRDALEHSGARVVIVNIDDGDDPRFDEVYDLLDDDRYRVLINDGGVTSALSGWDQARWMRHLAAKIFGNGDVHPPRPADAEPVPVAVDADVGDVAPADTLVETAYEAAAETKIELASAPEPELQLELESESVSFSGADSRAEPPRVDDGALDFDLDLDLDAILPPEPAATAAAEPERIELASAEPESPAFDLDEVSSSAQIEQVIELASTEGDDGFGLEDWSLVDEDAIPTAPESLPVVAAHDAEAMAVPDVDDALAGIDLDFDFDAPPPPLQLETPGDVLQSAGEPGAWSIDALLDDVLAPPPVVPDEEVSVEKVSAAEYLAPPAEGSAPPPADSAFTLELVPLEEVVAPVPVERVAQETWLDPDSAQAAKIRRIWVFGASIGGPEAVRSVLAQLPRDYPALFLVAQHLGDEFVETMTRQLARACALTVRTPAHGERASHGEVLVVPNGRRLRVEPSGVVVLQDLPESVTHRPSIDLVLEDVAERFGANAGAIVFSGMSDDAAAGCKAIAERGGCVYVQSPDSCVVGTMVEGVLETGVVQFQGTPEELARKLNDERA